MIPDRPPGPYSERDIDIAVWILEMTMAAVAKVETLLRIPATQQYHDVCHGEKDLRKRVRHYFDFKEEVNANQGSNTETN